MTNKECKHLNTKPEVKQIALYARGLVLTGRLVCTDCGAVVSKVKD